MIKLHELITLERGFSFDGLEQGVVEGRLVLLHEETCAELPRTQLRHERLRLIFYGVPFLLFEVDVVPRCGREDLHFLAPLINLLG